MSTLPVAKVGWLKWGGKPDPVWILHLKAKGSKLHCTLHSPVERVGEEALDLDDATGLVRQSHLASPVLWGFVEIWTCLLATVRNTPQEGGITSSSSHSR